MTARWLRRSWTIRETFTGRRRCAEEDLGDRGVELASCLRGDLRARFLGGPGPAIRPVAGDRVECVREREDPRGERDRVAAEPVRVPRAVPSLVAVDDDVPGGVAEVGDLGDDPPAEQRVAPHDLATRCRSAGRA